METFKVKNVHEALPEVLRGLEVYGVSKETRNGTVTMFDGPVAVEYEKPTERVMFWPERDANPFFHFFESLWMLGGRRDVGMMSYFLPSISKYSDDGLLFHGAYGYRWRAAFQVDQIQEVIRGLRRDPLSRRFVLQMWDAKLDLGKDGKDLPCNLSITVQINHAGELDITVFNRSNDILWGALGANAVHFSMLQEYLAGRISVPVGRYWQISSNFHCYMDATYEKCRVLAQGARDPLHKYGKYNPYDLLRKIAVYPMAADSKGVWDAELEKFLKYVSGFIMESPHRPLPNAWDFGKPYFCYLAVPLFRAFAKYKTLPAPDKYDEALEGLKAVGDCDWKVAASEWLERRKVRWEQKGETKWMTKFTKT